MLPLERELAAFKFLDGFAAHLKEVREPHKALRHAVRDTREFFQATHACIATLQAGRSAADLLFTLPKHADWDLGVLTRYIRHTHPPVQRDMLIASVRRRGGAWGAIALIRPGLPYGRDDQRLLTRIATALSEAIHRIDRSRFTSRTPCLFPSCRARSDTSPEPDTNRLPGNWKSSATGRSLRTIDRDRGQQHRLSSRLRSWSRAASKRRVSR